MVQPGDRHQFGIEDVAAFLRDHGWRDALAISRIDHGEWSLAFSFAVDGHAVEYVVRFSALDEDFRKDQLAARHASRALPIPRILELGDAFDGLFYAISERARGEHLDALDVARLRRALPSLFAAIDGMRVADVSATRGFGLWDASGQAPHPTWRDALLAIGTDTPTSRIAGWRPRLEQSPTGAAPFDRAFAHLSRLSAELPNARHLIHADLLNYNVLVDGDRVSGVLDWGSAMYGDWLFDIAWFTFWQPWYPAWSAIDFAAEAERFRASIDLHVDDFATRMRGCEIAIGLDNQAYCAYKGEARWPQLEAVARRTLALCAQSR
jgi:hygromycin-B 4-O-kinase